MFTGLVEQIGQVKSLSPNGALEIAYQPWEDPLQKGESIVVNGACLTVTDFNTHRFSVQVSPESFSRSNLGELAPGSPVNLERALRLGDRLGGHMVSGHIDCRGQIASIENNQNFYQLRLVYPRESAGLVVEKGSIAVDGVSLTINGCNESELELTIIPETWNKTIIQNYKKGTRVNLEFDMLAKHIQKLWKQQGKQNEKLSKH